MRKFLLTFALLFLPAMALAQGGSEQLAAAINWFQIAALAINTVGVTLAVQVLKYYLPSLPGPAKTLLTLTAGPLLLLASDALSNLLGFPIDFTSLIEIFGAGLLTSVAAMVPFKVGKAQQKAKMLRRR